MGIENLKRPSRSERARRLYVTVPPQLAGAILEIAKKTKQPFVTVLIELADEGAKAYKNCEGKDGEAPSTSGDNGKGKN